MVHKKAKSKRQTTKMREKIRKKTLEHHRKVRREAKKNALLPNYRQSKRAKKDLGIPNLYPFKKEMLLKAMDETKARRELAKKRKVDNETVTKSVTFKGPDFDDLARDAEARARTFVFQDQANDGEQMTNENERSDISVKAYYKEFKKVVEASDVILEVLDCRDPLRCRPKNIEKMILNSGKNDKRIVLVLNKIDLVPKEVVIKWLNYLRNELPTVAFRSSTKESRNVYSPLKRHDISIEQAPVKLMKKGECLGAESLMNILKSYCMNNGVKSSIVVGVIGYPNVGKSSVINSLKRYKVCKVGAEAGITKSMQQISLDKNIKLLDCPGVLFCNDPTNNNYTSAINNLHLRSMFRKKKTNVLKDAFSIIEMCGKDQLSGIFGVVSFDEPINFLILLAKKRGRILKRGIPDIKSAAEILINEWDSGIISFYTLPPLVREENINSNYISTEIVSSWSKEFNIDEIIEAEKNSLMQIDDPVKSKQPLVIRPSSLSESITMDEDEDNNSNNIDPTYQLASTSTYPVPELTTTPTSSSNLSFQEKKVRFEVG